jgi:hypothetical protein
MGEWRYSSTILDFGSRWRRVISFTPRSLYPRGKSPGTHRIRGWVGPRAGLDHVENRNRIHLHVFSNWRLDDWVGLVWCLQCVSCHLGDWTEKSTLRYYVIVATVHSSAQLLANYRTSCCNQMPPQRWGCVVLTQVFVGGWHTCLPPLTA